MTIEIVLLILGVLTIVSANYIIVRRFDAKEKDYQLLRKLALSVQSFLEKTSGDININHVYKRDETTQPDTTPDYVKKYLKAEEERWEKIREAYVDEDKEMTEEYNDYNSKVQEVFDEMLGEEGEKA